MPVVTNAESLQDAHLPFPSILVISILHFLSLESLKIMKDPSLVFLSHFLFTGIITSAVSFSGGAENLNYFMNVDYFGNTGYMETPQEYERISTNLNLNGTRNSHKKFSNWEE